jgi:hypothetical protein
MEKILQAVEGYLDYCFEGGVKIWTWIQDCYGLLFLFLAGVILTPFAIINWFTGD